MKKLTALTASLLLILTLVFSLSSCLGTFVEILAPDLGTEDGEAKDNEKNETEEGGEKTPSDNVNTGDQNPGEGENEDGEGEDGENAPEFLPNYDESIEITQPSKAMLSVVSIVSSFEVNYGSQGSVGSGVIYKLDKQKGDAYIITNYHVVFNRYAITKGGISEDIGLYLYGMELSNYKISATYVGGSLTRDLAVLKVEGSEVLKNSYARAADIGDSDLITVMDKVIAVGNPEGYGISVTTGIVSVDSETLEMTGADAQTGLSLRVIRIDAAINEGNSGGGLFDEQGNLIGIVNAKRTGSDVDNIAYAIPISYAKNFAENIIYYCTEDNFTPYKCLLGVTVTANVTGIVPDPDTGKLVRKELVEVSELTDNSSLSGKLTEGDIILSITVDGVKKEVTRIHHLIDHVLTARVGSTVTLEFDRDGTVITETVTVPESALTAVN